MAEDRDEGVRQCRNIIYGIAAGLFLNICLILWMLHG